MSRGSCSSDPEPETTSKMRSSTRSAKQVALKRLSSSFEENFEDNFDKSDTSDNSDKEERMVFKEEDIVLVEYEEEEEPCKQENRRRGRKGKAGKAVLQDSGIEEDFEEREVPEAIVIDFDTPLRKLQTESKIFLKNINSQQIPEAITEREMLRFARLEKICKANLKRQSMDEMMEEEEEEEKRMEEEMSMSIKRKPVKRVRFE